MPTATMEDVNRLFERALSTTDEVMCVDRQLACWDMLKGLIPAFPVDLNDPRRDAVPGFCDSLYDWLPTLEVDLGELASRDASYVDRYLTFMEDMVTKISADDHRMNFHRSYAEALGLAGRRAEAEQVIARLLEEDPKDGWTWLTWGDLYLDGREPDKARALEIFHQGVAAGADNAEGLLDERLRALQRPATAPAVSTKVGRNDACPCGSAKKYKKCCGA